MSSCLLIASLLTPSAHGFPHDQGEAPACKARTFRFDGLWNSWSQARDWARTTIDTWEGPKDHWGEQLVFLSETTDIYDTGAVVVKIVDMGQGGAYGRAASCSNLIEMNVHYLGNENAVKDTIQHEMGHVLGLGHTGDDAADGNTGPAAEAMASCVALRGAFGLSSDDAASLNYTWSDTTNRQILANDGFEGGMNWWLVSGAAETLIDSTGGVTGDHKLRWKRDIAGNFLFQRSYLAANSNAQDFRAVARYKLASDQYTGAAQLKLYGQLLDHTNLTSETDPCGLLGIWTSTPSSLSLASSKGRTPGR